MGANKRVEAVENITIQLRGEDAENFRRYKKREFILKNADACRRLVLHGLNLWLADFVVADRKEEKK